MITYNVIFDEQKDKGVYAISVVESPAMKSEFIALNKQSEVKLSEVDDVKFLLAGVVLVPDRDVYRNQDGKEFNIRFSKDTISDVAHNFIKQGYQGNSSIEHKTKIDGVSIVQSWVVKDVNNDTANAYGLPKEDIKEGSWVVLYKCDNKEIYSKAINGEIKGFSIDGLFSLEEVNLKTEVRMTKDDLKEFGDELLNSFKTLLSSKPKEAKATEVKLGSAMLKGGEAQIEYTSEVPTVGDEAYVLNGEEKAPLPVGEYELEDGQKLVVAEEGRIAEVLDAVVEEEVNADLNDEGAQMADDIKQLMKSLTIKYAEQTKEMFDALEVKLSAQAEEIETLKKTPAAVSLSSAPSTKKYSELTEYEKRQLNK